MFTASASAALKQSLRGMLLGPADGAVYVNALDDALEAGERPVREAYGANYERLRQLKKKYDPTNLFRQNSNMNPISRCSPLVPQRLSRLSIRNEHPVDGREVTPGISEHFGICGVIRVLHGHDAAAQCRMFRA